MADSLAAIQTKTAAYLAHLVTQHLDTATVDCMLNLEREAYEGAMTAGDLEHADEHYRRLDVLLEHRVTMPLQRKP